MIIKEADFQEYEVSKMVKGTVVPRAIAWISTVSKEGVRNLAPYSFFTVAALNPVIFCISVGPGSAVGKAGDKDTLANIKETEEFVINIVSEAQANGMHKSSKIYENGVDEFKKAGLKSAQSTVVNAPAVEGAPVSMECKLNRIINVGRNQLVLGKLVCYHIREDVHMEGNHINYQTLKPIGRMTGDYAYVRDFFALPNPQLPNYDSDDE